MAGEYVLSIRDHTREMTTVTIPVVELTAANIENQISGLDTLQSAIDAVTLGVLAKRRIVAEADLLSGDAPASALAQREVKWLVQATDDVTGRPVQFEIGTADLTLLDTNSEEMDQSLAAYTTLVGALETSARSINGNTITVQRIVFVTRNT